MCRVFNVQYDVFVEAVAGSEKTYGRIVVNVTDVNDNRPTFARPLYQTQVTEEDDRHLPRQILQVSYVLLYCW